MSDWRDFGELEGSPAHAGIDLLALTLRSVAPWFPRTRGDRPVCECAYGLSYQVPPHTRG